jgi:hypothetical protein
LQIRFIFHLTFASLKWQIADCPSLAENNETDLLKYTMVLGKNLDAFFFNLFFGIVVGHEPELKMKIPVAG